MKTKIVTNTAREILMERMISIKKSLKEKGVKNYVTLYQLYYPEFNTEQKHWEIRTAWNLRSANKEVVEGFENILTKLSRNPNN